MGTVKTTVNTKGVVESNGSAELVVEVPLRANTSITFGTDATTFAGVVTFNSGVITSGTTVIAGPTYLTNTAVGVSGNVTFAKTVTVNGPLYANTTLGVSGNTNLGAQATITGPEYALGDLNVSGTTTLGNRVTIGGACAINGTQLTVNSQSVFSGSMWIPAIQHITGTLILSESAQHFGFSPYQLDNRASWNGSTAFTVDMPGMYSMTGGTSCTGTLPPPSTMPGAMVWIVLTSANTCLLTCSAAATVSKVFVRNGLFSASLSQFMGGPDKVFGTKCSLVAGGSCMFVTDGFYWIPMASTGTIRIDT